MYAFSMSTRPRIYTGIYFVYKASNEEGKIAKGTCLDDNNDNMNRLFKQAPSKKRYKKYIIGAI